MFGDICTGHECYSLGGADQLSLEMLCKAIIVQDKKYSSCGQSSKVGITLGDRSQVKLNEYMEGLKIDAVN